jgi:copper chaperone CopZ
MKKTFVLDGLDCANCAAKIEHAVSRIDGVENANVNFMTTKLTIEGSDSLMDEIIRLAEKAVRKTDPDVTMRKV